MQIPVEVVIFYSKPEARLCGSVTEEPIPNKARKHQQLEDCEVRKHIAKYTQAHQWSLQSLRETYLILPK